MKNEVITFDNDEDLLNKWFNAYQGCFELDYNNDDYEGLRYFATLNNDEVFAKYYCIMEDDRVICGALIFVIGRAVWVLYLFSVPEYRGKGYAKEMMDAVNQDYPPEQYLYIVEVEKRENFESIKNWWLHRGYKEVPIDYYVPKINNSGREIGVLTINELLCKTQDHELDTGYLLKVIETYFKYGFCRGNTEVKNLEAYKLNEKQLKKATTTRLSH